MTKKESSMLYGIAITMMLFLHLFATNTECYSFLNHLFRNSNILHHTAWFCKICVSIYAFISGYGLYKSNEKDVYIEVKQSIKNDFLFSMKHLLKLYKKYWIVFIIFVPLGFYIERFTNFSFHIFILSSLGMSSSYNGTWWYIKQYVIFVLIFPLINFIFKEGIKRSERISCCVITIISMGFLLEKNVLNKSNCAYCLIFLIGFITSKYMIIEKFRRIICEYSLVSRRIVIYFVIFLCICVRSAFTLKWGGDGKSIDVLIILPFVFSICEAVVPIKKLFEIFCRIGKYSTYMWLVHDFFITPYAGAILDVSNISIIKYMILFITSLVIAMLLTLLERKLDCFIIKCRHGYEEMRSEGF